MEADNTTLTEQQQADTEMVDQRQQENGNAADAAQAQEEAEIARRNAIAAMEAFQQANARVQALSESDTSSVYDGEPRHPPYNYGSPRLDAEGNDRDTGRDNRTPWARLMMQDVETIAAGEAFKDQYPQPGVFVDPNVNFSYIGETEFNTRFKKGYEKLSEKGPVLGKTKIEIENGDSPILLVMFILNFACRLTMGAKILKEKGLKLVDLTNGNPAIVNCKKVIQGKLLKGIGMAYFKNLVPQLKIPNYNHSIGTFADMISSQTIDRINNNCVHLHFSKHAQRKLKVNPKKSFENPDISENEPVYIYTTNTNDRIIPDKTHIQNLIKDNDLLSSQNGDRYALPLTLGLSVDEFIVYLESSIVTNKKRLNLNRALIRHLHVRLGHVGGPKLVKILRCNYKIGKDNEKQIIEVCDSCGTCKQFKPRPSSNKVSMPRSTTFNSWVDLDLKIYSDHVILYVMDSFTSFIMAKIIPNKNAETVFRAFTECWLNVFGSPLSGIASDNGGEFRNSTFHNYCSTQGLKHFLSPSYYPQACGKIEKNHALVDSIYEKCRLDNKDWSKERALAFAVHSYNSCPGGLLNLSPLFLVTGQAGKLPAADAYMPVGLDKDKNTLASEMLRNLYNARKRLLDQKFAVVAKKLCESNFFPERDYDIAVGDNIYYYCNKEKGWFTGRILVIRGSVVDINSDSGTIKSVPIRWIKPFSESWSSKYYDNSFDYLSEEENEKIEENGNGENKKIEQKGQENEKIEKNLEPEIIDLEVEKNDDKILPELSQDENILPIQNISETSNLSGNEKTSSEFIDMKNIMLNVGDKIKMVFKSDPLYHYDAEVLECTKRNITIIDLYDNEQKKYLKSKLMFNYSRPGDEGRGPLEGQEGREEGVQGGPDEDDGVPPDGPAHRSDLHRRLPSVDDVAFHQYGPDDERPPGVYGLHRDQHLVPDGEKPRDGHRSDPRADQRGKQDGQGASCYFIRVQRHPPGHFPGADLCEDQEDHAQDVGPPSIASISSGPRRGDGIRAQIQEGSRPGTGPEEDQPACHSRGHVEGCDEVRRPSVRGYQFSVSRPAIHEDGVDQLDLRRTLPPTGLCRGPGLNLQGGSRLPGQAHRARRPRRDRPTALDRRCVDRSGEGVRAVQAGDRIRDLAATAGGKGADAGREKLGVAQRELDVQAPPRPPSPGCYPTKGRGKKTEPGSGSKQRPRSRERIRPRRTKGRSPVGKADIRR